jgi:mono/diheme cytochrome c family protein
VSLDTPFGTIHSTNITSDQDTGIGKWTLEELRRSLHEGIAAKGYRLFPAFPYTEFTRITDADVDAIYAYISTIRPIRATPIANGFIFSQRWTLRFWNALFFKQGQFSPNNGRTSEWNRGAYLVEGLGHCGACHTPRNILMAEVSGKEFTGGVLMDKVASGKRRRWSAVNLTSATSGLGSWSLDEITNYLHSGFSVRAGSFGPMNDVIVNSLSKMTVEDLHAVAVYLKSLPAVAYNGPAVPTDKIKAGEDIYRDRCQKCHSPTGRGGFFSGPPLAGSSVAQAVDPASFINIILYGADNPESVVLGSWETMKPFQDVLNDEDVAAVANYVRGSWGHRAPPVSPADVSRQR